MFVDGEITADGGLAGQDIMGREATWLAFTSRAGGHRRPTLLFVDRESPRHPTRWFVRNSPVACASFAFAFAERVRLAVGDALSLAHDIVVASDELDPQLIRQLVHRRR